jgi:Rad3-related DNA helicase
MAQCQKDFHHPYDPYPIQREFMNALYECLDKGQVGIFESPTGIHEFLGKAALCKRLRTV